MEFNTCNTCGAKDGRAGLLIDIGFGDECLNCNDTRKTGSAVIHLQLKRTDEEIKKTFNILEK